MQFDQHLKYRSKLCVESTYWQMSRDMSRICLNVCAPRRSIGLTSILHHHNVASPMATISVSGRVGERERERV